MNAKKEESDDVRHGRLTDLEQRVLALFDAEPDDKEKQTDILAIATHMLGVALVKTAMSGPPESPIPILYLKTISDGIKFVTDNITKTAANQVGKAEADGVVLAIRSSEMAQDKGSKRRSEAMELVNSHLRTMTEELAARGFDVHSLDEDDEEG